MIEFNGVFLKYHYEQYSLFEDLGFSLVDGLNTVLCDIQSGKTSLCKLILGQIAADDGTVSIDGTKACEKDFVPSVLYLPKKPTFFDNRSVLYNLRYPLKVRGMLPQDEKMSQLAMQFDLEDVLHEKVKKLDCAQQKRLALARGLTVSRNIVLFDDFFDDTTCIDDIAAVLSLFRCKTYIIVTSNPDFAMGNTVVIRDKKCVFQGDSDTAKKIVAQSEWLATRLKDVSDEVST